MRNRFLLLVGLVAGCGSEPTTTTTTGPQTVTPAVRPQVSATVNPATIVPGQSAQFQGTATPPPGKRFDVLRVRLGDGVTTDSTDIAIKDQPVSFSLTVNSLVGPYSGALSFTVYGTVDTMTASSTATLTLVDDGPPKLTISDTMFVNVGDTAVATFAATDSAGIKSVELKATGAITTTQIVAYSSPASRRNGEFRIPVPAGTKLGDTVHIEIKALDGFDKPTTKTTRIRAGDNVAPVVSGTVGGPTRTWWAGVAHDSSYVAGDTVRIRARGKDNLRLAWVGYRLIKNDAVLRAESLAVSTKEDSALFSFVVPDSLDGVGTVSWFAKDSVGNPPDVKNGVIRFLKGVERPIQPIALSAGSFARVYDSKRDRMYFSAGSDGVRGLSLQTMDTVASPPFVGITVGIDLTPSNDSLVAVVYNPDTQLYGLAIASLAAPATPISLINLPWVSAYRPRMLAITADNRVILPMVGDPSAPDTNVVEINLASPGRRTRTVNRFPAEGFARSQDRSFMVGWDDRGAASYRVLTDVFGGVVSVPIDLSGMRLNGNGSVVEAAGKLYNNNLALTRTLAISPAAPFPNEAISADGSTVWAAIDHGYLKIRASDGVVLERVILPLGAESIDVLPGEETMVVTADGGWVGVVDLR